MFYYPDQTNGVFVGWTTIEVGPPFGRKPIGPKKQDRVQPFSDYLLISVAGNPGRVYSLLGRAGQGFDGNGRPQLWSCLHKGLNSTLNIAANTTFQFPPVFTFTGVQASADPQTGNMSMREATSTYLFSPPATQAANNGGKTLFDLVSALTSSLARQGYQLQP